MASPPPPSPFHVRDPSWSEATFRSEDDTTPRITAVYARRKGRTSTAAVDATADVEQRPSLPPRLQCRGEHRASFAPARRPSWNRSLNVRGRSSIVVLAGADIVVADPDRKEDRKTRPPRPPGKKKFGKQEVPDFRKEISYFQEIDAVELLEESPSPRKFSTWVTGLNSCYIDDLSSILRKWKITKLANSYRRSGVLFDIMETPVIESSSSEVSEQGYVSGVGSELATLQKSISSKLSVENSVDDASERCIIDSLEVLEIREEACGQGEVFTKGSGGKDAKEASRKWSLSSHSSLFGQRRNAFTQLLDICRQSEPLALSDVLSHLRGIVKMGEGTYGEVFRAGDNICKIVPIDGDQLVNGETQKRSEEVLEEVLLSLTLNSLKGQHDDDASRVNSCGGFIETRDCRICRGAYDASLIKAWEDWDSYHCSENDHPKEFLENQCYIVFVLADGGKDLESFVLSNYAEAQSLLMQVAASLAVAEVAFEFEHRDLHWGNVLVSRKDIHSIDYCIEGKRMRVETNGVITSIIDFTLSRINTGEAILFLDLSSDPGLFEGPKGDKQSETYRKMKEVTEECWEGSFPKTNVLWLQYLVDTLLTKKSFKRTTNDERDLRSFRKRLNSYNSIKDSLSDSFFTNLYEEVK